MEIWTSRTDVAVWLCEKMQNLIIENQNDCGSDGYRKT
jgi:hypothetical protein